MSTKPEHAMNVIEELLSKFYSVQKSEDGLKIIIPFLSFDIVITVIRK
jgi:hypothetical protein